MADKYYVQDRKSVTTMSGIKGPADEVTEKMFKGEKSFKALIDAKIIGTEKPDIRTKAELVKAREEEKLAKKNKAAEKKKTMTEDEAELVRLKAEATELKIEFKEDIKAEALQKLIDKAKK